MKYLKSQSGSAHVVVILLLVIALLGALGFVFYQNFIAKKAEAPVIQQVIKEPTIDTARLAFDSDIYELDYPKEWQVAAEKPVDAQSRESVLKITNPDQTVQVTLSVSAAGIDGACDANDGLKVRYYKVHPAAEKHLTGVPLYVVEAMSDYPGGGYLYTIGLAPDGGETHAALGDSHCTVKNVGVASSVVIDGATGKVTTPTIFAGINFPKLPGAKESKAKSMQEVKDILATDDYKAAIKTLESARKK